MKLFEIESEHFGGEVKVIRHSVFPDGRGFLTPTYLKDEFEGMGIRGNFVRDMESFSVHNVIRGLHFQLKPAMGKIMRVTRGMAKMVAVDVRSYSPTYLKYHSLVLSESEPLQIWASSGFARGFQTFGPTTIQYKCDEYFSPENDLAIRWNDPIIGIGWTTKTPTLSERDRSAPFFKDLAATLWRSNEKGLR